MDKERKFRKNYAKKFSRGHWTFLGLGEEKSGAELSVSHLKTIASQMVERFKETSHPVFESISDLSRGILKRKNNRDFIHFNAHASNTQFLFRTIHSANQLSIYGAVSSWCEEFGRKPNEKGSTTESFVAKESEQRQKNVKPQEVKT